MDSKRRMKGAELEYCVQHNIVTQRIISIDKLLGYGVSQMFYLSRWPLHAVFASDEIVPSRHNVFVLFDLVLLAYPSSVYVHTPLALSIIIMVLLS